MADLKLTQQEESLALACSTSWLLTVICLLRKTDWFFLLPTRAIYFCDFNRIWLIPPLYVCVFIKSLVRLDTTSINSIKFREDDHNINNICVLAYDLSRCSVTACIGVRLALSTLHPTLKLKNVTEYNVTFEITQCRVIFCIL